jgi:hypothetical protein
MRADIKMIAMGCKPDPSNFTIKYLKLVCGNTIVLAQYHGCKTFDGDKLILLKGNWNLDQLTTLDPHFLDENYAVIGRFIPTELGFKMAKAAAQVN